MTATCISSFNIQAVPADTLLTFKEAMNYLRVSRSTLYRLMWSGQLTGHKVGSTWRFYRDDLRASVQTPPVQSVSRMDTLPDESAQVSSLTAVSR